MRKWILYIPEKGTIRGVVTIDAGIIAAVMYMLKLKWFDILRLRASA